MKHMHIFNKELYPNLLTNSFYNDMQTGLHYEVDEDIKISIRREIEDISENITSLLYMEYEIKEKRTILTRILELIIIIVYMHYL
jgi:hypothetical protein